MNREVEELLPAALRAARTYLMQDKKQEIVFKEYDGYAANLGASIRTSGLLPALSFFTDVAKMKEDGKPYRNRLLVAILAVLGENIPDDKENQGRELLRRVVVDYYRQDPFVSSDPPREENRDSAALTNWRNRIIPASVALKLALRAFRHTDKETSQN